MVSQNDANNDYPSRRIRLQGISSQTIINDEGVNEEQDVASDVVLQGSLDRMSSNPDDNVYSSQGEGSGLSRAELGQNQEQLQKNDLQDRSQVQRQPPQVPIPPPMYTYPGIPLSNAFVYPGINTTPARATTPMANRF